MVIVILALIGLAIILALILTRLTIRTPTERYGPPYDLPPLNYFESAESPILSFWYDPVVSTDEGEQTTWGFSRDEPPSHATNIDEVFGPDSYVRFNIEDLDLNSE